MHAYSQDLHIALRKVLAKVTDANNSSLPLDSPDHETALTVEYSDVHGNLQPVIMEGDLKKLRDAKAIYVTTTAAPVLSPQSNSLAEMTAVEDAVDEESDLIDLSLSGCCGIKSNYGGLEISSISIPFMQQFVPCTAGSKQRRAAGQRSSSTRRNPENI